MSEVTESTPQEPGKIILPVLFPGSISLLPSFPEYGKKFAVVLDNQQYYTPGKFLVNLTNEELSSLVDIAHKAVLGNSTKENTVSLYFLIALMARGEGQTDLTGEEISTMGVWVFFLLTVEMLRRLTKAPVHVERYSLFEFNKSFILKGWTLEDLYILWEVKGMQTLNEVFQGAAT